ncbi:hypothetical protein [Pseudomonas baetica]|uniref:hypothetical protein n=1 Tax=Pseudomonas baetica TaxID=674054 RepID=UPI00240518D8|nr:hypothetical protein [Pseudomonas baetica]MDF9779258.1 beta-lactamase class A [Pseudomonas baetica]
MSASIARVHVNGIEVGSLPLETYNTIVACVRQDRRLYLAFTVKLLGVGLRMLLWGTCAVPVFLMIAFAFVLLAEPASITDLIATARAATPEAITAALKATLLFTWIGMLVLVPAVMAMFCPSLLAFSNPFTDAINRDVRSMLEVPAEGRVWVRIVEAPSSAE